MTLYTFIQSVVIFWSFLEQKELLTSSDEFVHGCFVSHGPNHLNLSRLQLLLQLTFTENTTLSRTGHQQNQCQHRQHVHWENAVDQTPHNQYTEIHIIFNNKHSKNDTFPLTGFWIMLIIANSYLSSLF